MGVFLLVWLLIFMNEISSCSGELESTRMRSVSVVILIGMRLSTTMRRGRISCDVARVVSMTKIFSCLSSSIAGRRSGRVRGIREIYNLTIYDLQFIWQFTIYNLFGKLPFTIWQPYLLLSLR